MKIINVFMIKQSYTELFIQQCIMQDIIMPGHELVIASNLSNAIHCIHKSNVKLHELDVYSKHMVIYVSLSTFSLVIIS